VYAPSEFYGCTLVVIVNGHGVVMGHFAEEKPNKVVCLQDQASVDQIKDKLETAEAMVDVDNVKDTQAWIIYSDDIPTSSLGYKAIHKNLADKDMMNIPTANIHNVSYRRGGGGGNSDKLVVQWSPKSDGSEATLHVYIRSDTPAFTGHYDCNGKAASGTSKLKERATTCKKVKATKSPKPVQHPPRSLGE